MTSGKVLVVDEPRLDFRTAEGFQERLLSAVDDGTGPLVIDFSAVEYIASVGLRALIVGSKKGKAAGREIRVAALQPLVREIFQISRFDRLMTVCESVADALAEDSPT